jgi:hypothetical protein
VDWHKGCHFKKAMKAQGDFEDFAAGGHIVAASINVFNNSENAGRSLQLLTDWILKATAFYCY